MKRELKKVANMLFKGIDGKKVVRDLTDLKVILIKLVKGPVFEDLNNEKKLIEGKLETLNGVIELFAGDGLDELNKWLEDIAKKITKLEVKERKGGKE